jgi:hypothetical protein
MTLMGAMQAEGASGETVARRYERSGRNLPSATAHWIEP